MTTPNDPPQTEEQQEPVEEARFDALRVLAELELVQRKSDLLERRIVAWESELIRIQKQLKALEKARDPQAPEWQEKLQDLQHRVQRLERRREAQAAPPPPASPSLPLAGSSLSTLDLESVAIVRAHWAPSDAKPGEIVKMLATCDGIPAGEEVLFCVRSLVGDTPLAKVQGESDGQQLQARWEIPDPPKFRELFFELSYEGAQTRSPVLVLPEA